MHYFNSINPYNLHELNRYPQWEHNAVGEAIAGSDEAFAGWRCTPFAERQKLLHQLAQALENNIEGLAEMATLEMGKPIGQAHAEIEKCAWLCRHYAEHGEAYLAGKTVDTDAAESYTSHEPLGIILGVMPWNFPYWQVMRFAIPTLMAGNTVLVKHASNVQGCAKAIEEIFQKAGFPRHTYTNLPIASALVEMVIRHPEVKGVSLTGSEKAGAAVAKTAGSELKPSLLELGGSNAMVVLADADIESATELALQARMQNNGQSCIAAKRFILHRDIAKEFTDQFLEKVAHMKSGNPMDAEVYLGPLARIDLAEELERQVAQSVKRGAVLRAGGRRQSAFYEATVLDGVKPGMPAFDEETFGPVAALCTARDDHDAIALVNCSRFGLGATICTKDLEKAKRLGAQIKDGAVFINEMVKSDPRLPFGGTGLSGYGRELGAQGIRAFTNLKTWYVQKAD